MKILCWIGWHRWAFVCGDMRKHINLMHLSTMAGTYQRCVRCSSIFDDLGEEARAHFKAEGRIQ